MAKNSKTKKAWQGRFSQKSHQLLEKFNASLSFDRRLYREDIQGSMAHAKGLQRIKVLTQKECSQIQKGLKQVLQEIESGKFKWSDALEDIHMAIESRLTEIIGPAGGKLHTGRSRNDQVALDLRLYCRRKLQELLELLDGFQSSLIQLAEEQGLVPMPGYTHLQRAQPVLLAHHLLAYFEMIQRDKARLQNALERVNVCPLGSGALAGSPFPLDREFVAKELGFKSITQNSLDGVSDRDFVAEILFDLSLHMVHLSRLSEELILWSTQEFQFISLPQSFCTGSSMMPQKMNPDVPELVRGKSGRVIGSLMGILTVIKGLPLAYNKDLQEDKEPLFDAIDNVELILQILTAMIPQIEVHAPKMREATQQGFLLATDIADYLVEKKLPFRSAHEVSGNLVQYCIKKNKILEELELSELREYSDLFKPDVFEWLDLKNAINRRSLTGGPAYVQVMKQLRLAKKKLG